MDSITEHPSANRLQETMCKHNQLTHRRSRRRNGTAGLLLLVAVGLGGCATGGGWSTGAAEERAARLAFNGEYVEAADIYIGLASDAEGEARDRLTLLAAEQWLNAGDASRARIALQSVQPPATGPVFWLWSANAAALALYEGRPERALDILEPLSRESLTLDHRLRVEALRADARFQFREPARAIELLIQREAWLGEETQIRNNRQRIWNGLLLSNPQVLREAGELATDPVVRGWLALGSLATTTGRQGIGWSNGIVRWREQNPDHPAFLLLDELRLPDETLLDYPRRIALLLPLSGRAASAGKAIQNGFLGAYFATAGGLDDRQTLRIYDVDAEGGASAAYASAVADGAEFVVGPLLRESVADLANDILVPVPVLTLNYLPEDSLAPPGLFQFALSPEDEARSAAERALLDGHTRGVALVPNNNWGRRLLTSFATAFESMGGTLLDYRSYTPSNQDFSLPIEDLMALSGSVRRYQRLRANLGAPLQFDPRRRQDVEFVFLAADAPAGRLMKSQLKFHYSGDLPAYSTSSINAMDGRSNNDLNGIRFADTPWLIDPPAWLDYLPEIYREYWPEERRLGRLHAMGYDAYHLVAPLFAMRGGGIVEIDGATGRLFLDVDGRVHRKLAWAEFRSGNVVALPEPEDVDVPVDSVEYGEPIPATPRDQAWSQPTREL